MDFIKAQLDRIQQQLAGLNATQKMLTAALAAIMVITVVWWGKYASDAEMVPLLDVSLSANDIGQIKNRLESKQYRFAVAGDRIQVPADQRVAILADLTFARLLPHNTQSGIDDILNKMNPFDPESKDLKLWNEHKQQFLSQIIGSIEGVARADVIIDPTSTRRIGADIEPSATAYIQLDPGQRDRQRFVDAAAALLAGAQSGLNYNHITVVVNNQVCRVHDPSSDSIYSGGEQLTLKKQYEDEAEEHIRREFRYMGDISVVVTMKLNATDIQMEEQKFDTKNSAQKETKTTETNDQTTGGSSQSGGEAGTVPNTSFNLQGGGGGGATAPSETRSQTETQFQNFMPSTRTVSKTPAGSAAALSAALHVPYSYFVNEYKSHNPSTKEPTDAELQPLVTKELAAMQTSVANLLDLSSPAKVTVGTYADAAPELSGQYAVASKPTAVSAMVGGHVKEIALGTLALMSLFMASMMVRKSIPTPLPVPVTPAAVPSMPPMLIGGEPLAGEVGSGDALLDGMELNDDAIKAQQMVDQVSTMVRENPDGAASLVKRWLNRS